MARSLKNQGGYILKNQVVVGFIHHHYGIAVIKPVSVAAYGKIRREILGAIAETTGNIWARVENQARRGNER